MQKYKFTYHCVIIGIYQPQICLTVTNWYTLVQYPGCSWIFAGQSCFNIYVFPWPLTRVKCAYAQHMHCLIPSKRRLAGCPLIFCLHLFKPLYHLVARHSLL